MKIFNNNEKKRRRRKMNVSDSQRSFSFFFPEFVLSLKSGVDKEQKQQ